MQKNEQDQADGEGRRKFERKPQAEEMQRKTDEEAEVRQKLCQGKDDPDKQLEFQPNQNSQVELEQWAAKEHMRPQELRQKIFQGRADCDEQCGFEWQHQAEEIQRKKEEEAEEVRRKFFNDKANRDEECELRHHQNSMDELEQWTANEHMRAKEAHPYLFRENGRP